MPNTNNNLHISKVNKDDEYYTRYEDIENELKNYVNYFKDKIIYCNCDNPKKSNFFKYLYDNFKNFKLNGLISTYYDENDNPIGIVMTRSSYDEIRLIGNGDFRSEECIELLKEADIIITNPPFSLLSEYVDQLIKYDKKFIIVGNMNGLTYNNIFSLIKNNKLWTGTNGYDSIHDFIRPDGSIKSFRNIVWYTNLDIPKRHKKLIDEKLGKHYDENSYKRYENFDGINISKLSDLPIDYYGIMGVPITYLIKHNPEEFEIIDMDKNLTYDHKRGLIDGKRLYARIFIKRKS